ncbi:hypothetical protein GCM10010254_74230 [Streptomyces chromofuscus]|nr:hypothetical protein GCM10010254_74230 [Streptomyces chromofuscus]
MGEGSARGRRLRLEPSPLPQSLCAPVTPPLGPPPWPPAAVPLRPCRPCHPDPDTARPDGGTLTRHIRTTTRTRTGTHTRPKGRPMPLEAGLLEILACPACHAPLEERDTELVCTGQDCGLAYPVRDGIPVLLVDEARRPA